MCILQDVLGLKKKQFAEEYTTALLFRILYF